MLLTERRALPLNALRYGPRQNAKSWPNKFQSRFIEPGIISYEDRGGDKELVSKEAIDRCIASFEGKPVIVKHGSGVTPQTMESKATGYIVRTWFEPTDGWYWCDGVIIDDETKDLIKSGWLVSCGYHVTDTDERGGEYHAIPYAREILAFEGEHLAIVEKPRYEGVSIRLNSKHTEGTMNVFKILKKIVAPAKPDETKPGAGEAADVSGDSEVTVDGKQIRLNDLVEAFKTRENAGSVTADTQIEVDGKPIKFSDIVAGYRANTLFEANRCHETPDEKKEREKKENEAADKKRHDDEEKKRHDDEEKKRHDDEEKKRADDAEAKKRADAKDEETRRNNERQRNTESFRILGAARNNPPVTTSGTPSFNSMDEKVERGRRLCSLKVVDDTKKN